MNHPVQTVPEATPASATRLGAVRLRVADIDRLTTFYARALGLVPVAPDPGDGVVRLGAPGGGAVVELEHAPDAPRQERGTSGLYHLAILVPERRHLAEALARAAGLGARFSGASDHLVSEALYLNDPEGNGIEIYRDRPRAQWPRTDDGALDMATLPLDLNGVMDTLGSDTPPEDIAAGTVLGHVHLRVDSLDAGRRFHAGIIGFDVTVDGYPGALFVAAGGYHHHVGMNTWTSNRPAVPGALGLAHYEVLVAGPEQVDAVRERAARAGVGVTDVPGGIALRDPAGNLVHVRT